MSDGIPAAKIVQEWFDIKMFVEDVGIKQTTVQKVWACNDLCLGELEKLAQGQEYYFAHYSDAPREGPHFKFCVRNVNNYDAFKNWCEDTKQKGKFKHFQFYDGAHHSSRDTWLRAKVLWDRARNMDKSDPIPLARKLLPLPELKNIGDGFHPFCNMLGLTYGAEDIFAHCLHLAPAIQQDWILLPLAAINMWDSGRKK